jgi:hypothetical protein
MSRRRTLLPEPVNLPFSAAAFVLWPLTCLPPRTPQEWAWLQTVYQAAFAEAQAVLRPSLPERDLLAVWN